MKEESTACDLLNTIHVIQLYILLSILAIINLIHDILGPLEFVTNANKNLQMTQFHSSLQLCNISLYICSVQFSCSVVSDSLQAHGP